MSARTADVHRRLIAVAAMAALHASLSPAVGAGPQLPAGGAGSQQPPHAPELGVGAQHPHAARGDVEPKPSHATPGGIGAHLWHTPGGGVTSRPPHAPAGGAAARTSHTLADSVEPQRTHDVRGGVDSPSPHAGAGGFAPQPLHAFHGGIGANLSHAPGVGITAQPPHAPAGGSDARTSHTLADSVDPQRTHDVRGGVESPSPHAGAGGFAPQPPHAFPGGIGAHLAHTPGVGITSQPPHVPAGGAAARTSHTLAGGPRLSHAFASSGYQRSRAPARERVLHRSPIPASASIAPDHLSRHVRTLEGLEEPVDVAFDGEERLWILERGAGRVRSFSIAGRSLGSIGARGTEEGRLLRPEGLALAADGTLWVADTGNHRVQAFAPDGRLLRVIGARGRGAGELCEPRSVAVDGDLLYVADTGNGRVQAFTLAGAPRSILEPPGRDWLEPSALAVRPGTLYVADAARARVDLLPLGGGEASTFGAPGQRPGLLRQPVDLVTHAPWLLVVERGNHRVGVHDLRGAALYTLGEADMEPGRSRGRLFAPRAAAVSPGGRWLAVVEDMRDRCALFGQDTGDLPHPLHPVDSVVRFGSGGGAGAGALVLLEPESGRILVHRADEAQPLPHAGVRLPDAGPFAALAPRDAAYDAARGWWWVSDPHTGRLLAFELLPGEGDGHRYDVTLTRLLRAIDLRALPPPGPWPATPGALACDDAGRLRVVCERNALVLVLDADHRLERTLGGFGDGPAGLRRPVDLACAPEGGLWVVDADRARVLRFDAGGALAATVGAEHLVEPASVAALDDGSLLVTDRATRTIARFSPTGELEGLLSTPGPGAIELQRPEAILASPPLLRVVDPGNRRGVVMDLEGRFLVSF